MTVPLTPAIGKYRLIAELGSGGMANVYLAVMRGRNGFNKLVVLKVPREIVSDDPMLLSMFLDEARLAARLNHRNVVQTFEVVEEAGRDVIVMEYLDGQTLNEILSRGRRSGKPLPLAMHLRIVAEALHGLHYAHELKDYNGKSLGLVHRDVSPHNIFVTFDGQVKVLDFGVAKATTSSHVTEAGTFKGKVRYMSPEQFAGAEIDRRADIFSVGVVLWEAATGHKLWKGQPDVDVISSVVHNKIPMPREVRGDANVELEAIIEKALAFKRDDRFASCVELQADLEKLIGRLETPSALADVGTFVSDLFAETRADRLRIIDEQVSRANSETSGAYRVLGNGELPGVAPSLPAIATTEARSVGSAGSGTGSIPNPAGTNASALTQPPKSRGGKFVAGLLMIVLGVTGAVIATRAALTRSAAPPPPVVAAAATPAADPATQAPKPVGEASITFSARPLDAKIYLDDQPLPSNPYMRIFPKDGSLHTLRIEASGHTTKTLGVHFDGDKELAVSLDKAESKPAAATRPASPAAAPAHPPTARPTAPPPASLAPAPANSPPTPSKPKRPERHIDDKL